MGTISQKLTYLNDTKGLLKEAINDLGGELTDESTFRSYAEALNGVYDKMPKITPPASNELVFQALNGKMEKSYFGDTEQDTSILPSEYTEVDYIESSGTQYVDTGLKGNQGTKIVMDTSIVEAGTICGNIEDTTQAISLRFHPTSSASISRFGNKSKTGIFTGYNYNTRYLIETSSAGVKVDNTLIYEWGEISNFETAGNLTLFGSGTASAKMKLYNCKIYGNNTLVRDFISCYRNSDNAVGLYDLVNDVFYENAGTGDFTYGSVVTRPSPDYPMPINVARGKQYVKFRDTLPKEYTRVDYIQGGSTQWINTGLKGTQNISFQADLVILGATYIGDFNDTSKALSLSSGNQFIGNQRRGDSAYNHTFETPSNRHIYENNLTGFYVDNVLKYEWSNVSDFQTNYNLKIGKGNSIGSNFQLYNCKIYNNNTLVRNFIPCYRNSDNEVGLYDLINGVFYTNQGTGVFTYGSEISNTYELNLKSKNIFNADSPWNCIATVGISGSAIKKFPYSTGDNKRTFFFLCKPNTTYTYSAKTAGDRLAIYEHYSIINPNEYTTSNQVTLDYRIMGVSDNIPTEYTFTTSGNAKMVAVYYSLNTIPTEIQIEENSQKTSYEPYFDYELCKVDTYEDEIYKNKSNGKWYLHNAIGKEIFYGTEIWSKSTVTSVDRFINDIVRTDLQVFTALSNYFINSPSSTTAGTFYFNTSTSSDYRGKLIVNFANYNTTTLADFKTWLSTHNLIVYYILGTPTDTEITSPTLIAQLEAIEAQRSVDGTNVITSECEEGLSVRIGVSALLKEVA